MQVILNKDASLKVQGYFKRNGLDLILFEGDGPYSAVKNHPDMHLFLDDVLYGDSDYGYNVFLEPLGKKYPQTIKYNIAKVGQTIFCKTDSVPRQLLYRLNKRYDLVHINQGYAKCSIAVIDHKSIITSDIGIQKAGLAAGIESLLIESGHILLPGLDYGFIGGACVRYKDEIFFSGDITQHPSYNEIKNFIEKRNLTIAFTEENLIDLGSFIILK